MYLPQHVLLCFKVLPHRGLVLSRFSQLFLQLLTFISQLVADIFVLTEQFSLLINAPTQFFHLFYARIDLLFLSFLLRLFLVILDQKRILLVLVVNIGLKIVY